MHRALSEPLPIMRPVDIIDHMRQGEVGPA